MKIPNITKWFKLIREGKAEFDPYSALFPDFKTRIEEQRKKVCRRKKVLTDSEKSDNI